MKRLFLYIVMLSAGVVMTSCSDDTLSETSVITDSVNAVTEFDKWLESNYRAPYNIKFMYRYEDIETDMTYDLVPAREIYCRILAKAIRYLWIDPYAENTDVHFMREYSPRVMMVIGSGAYNNNGTLLLGTAEGGLKITLYVGNWLERYLTIHYFNGVDETEGYSVTIDDIDQFNYYYLHTIHHEFAHILNQKKNYPTEFNTISQGDYAAQWNSLSEEEAAQKGFVSPYASSAAGEDFVEVYAYYLSWNEKQWADKIAQAGAVGAARIERKLAMVKNYMSTVWNIDVDQMRTTLARRYNDIDELDWSNFN